MRNDWQATYDANCQELKSLDSIMDDFTARCAYRHLVLNLALDTEPRRFAEVVRRVYEQSVLDRFMVAAHREARKFRRLCLEAA